MALLVACDSGSGSRSGGTLDAGPREAGSWRDVRTAAGDGAVSCNPFGQPPCPHGQTCCLSADLTGTCTDLGACTTNAEFECPGSDYCGTGEYCCATFINAPDGGPIAKAVCAAECAAPSRRTCSTTADCPAGSSCVLLPEGASSALLAVAAEAYISLCAETDGGTAP